MYRIHKKAEIPGERGLPKQPAQETEITPRGLVGDFNRYRHELLKDEPTSAVLIVPLETLEELQREGWPVAPGDLGENITTQGIPYQDMGPGTALEGGSVKLEVARPCDPCTNLYLLPYVGDERGPEFIKTTLGRRGWYCRVLRPGMIHVGDVITTLPGPVPSPAPL